MFVKYYESFINYKIEKNTWVTSIIEDKNDDYYLIMETENGETLRIIRQDIIKISPFEVD